MIVGIDLGTTNSLIAYFDEKEGAKIIPNRLGKNLTPSVVSFDEDGTVYVGETAKGRRITHPLQTVEVFKRDMGSQRTYHIGSREYTPVELSALVLKSLKEDAEEYLHTEITEAVISVPAYFNDHQRKATKKAGEMAGLKVERLINEPTAAAIAYGLDKITEQSSFIVFDLGGGTFDVSLLELDEGIMEVHCVAGDNFLGGEDFTKKIYEMFLNKNELEESDLSAKTKNHILKQAENCKVGFSKDKVQTICCNIDNQQMEMVLTEDKFKEACADLMERLKKPIERSLRDAKLTIKDIDRVVLVGGSTKMHIIRSYVGTLFHQMPDCSVNPDEVVVIGACMQAAMKERNKQVEDLILTDVCPYTLGTSIINPNARGDNENLYSPIIQRNTTVPASRTSRYCTTYNNQECISIEVYQGENRMANKNLLLDKLKVKVPMAPAGHETVSVTFTYDINALLEVIVKVDSTKETIKKIIKSPDCQISMEEAEARFAQLEYLKLPPREQEENKLVLFKAEELYEELLGNVREELAQAISWFEGILDRGEPEEIEEAREKMERMLHTLQYSPFL
ncbi:MAG: molecular chaperone HscC [Lachnospiraceae bacterium]|nr:molecular chaperone HscC [Lachnospiraceae bacterium]